MDQDDRMTALIVADDSGAPRARGKSAGMAKPACEKLHRKLSEALPAFVGLRSPERAVTALAIVSDGKPIDADFEDERVRHAWAAIEGALGSRPLPLLVAEMSDDEWHRLGRVLVDAFEIVTAVCAVDEHETS
jgi:hypothetical protein